MKQIIYKFIILGISILIPNISFCQYTNNIWCFGDSVGINFRNNSVFQSGVSSKSGISTIADSSGNLLFYGYCLDDSTNNTGNLNSAIIKNKLHFTMQNGINLIGETYHAMTIVPKSVKDSTFYVFTAGVIYPTGLYYSIIDLKLNNGLGDVIQKNIPLDTFPVFDGITAIKHGNGNDWWLIFQKGSISSTDSSDEYFIYSVDSNGIGNKITQSVGGYRIDGAGDLSFNSDGTKMIYCGWGGLLELFEFDRFSGKISNSKIIESGRYTNPFPYYASAVFSPNKRFLYITSYQNVYNKASCLYQYDLTSSNISASRILIDSFSAPIAMDEMEMGPDKKIYISGYDEQFGYPYPDTLHNLVTDNLSVINYPDSLGVACDFQPFSFYLGGNRGTIGLPNNPDYTLGPLDTITAVHEIKQQPAQNELKVFYQPQWDIAFINADKLHGKKFTLHVYDITGKEIFKEQGSLQPPYFTKDLGMSGFAKGVYIVTLQTEMEVLSKKFVKY